MRTAAGPVVDRLARLLGDCPVVQLGTGTVRADEETVERAVAEVGVRRLLVSVGSGTLTDIAKVTAQRTGSRHVAVQTACSINGFIADRSVLIVAGAKRTVASRWPDVLVADTDILTAAPWQLNLAGVGDLSTVPNAVAEWQLASRLGHGPRYDPAVVEASACRDPVHFRAWRGPHATPRRQASPILPGCWRRVAYRWESSARRHRHPAASTRCPTCSRWPSVAGRRRLLPHGMQVTVATRLAVRVWQLVDRTIRSGRTQVRVPDEPTSRNAVACAFAELGARTVEECWTAYSAKRSWLLAHQSSVEALVADWERFVPALTLPSPAQFDEVSHASGLPTRAADLGVGYDDDLLFWALRNSHLLRERISIVDLANLLGVWSDETARSIVADTAAAG